MSTVLHDSITSGTPNVARAAIGLVATAAGNAGAGVLGIMVQSWIPAALALVGTIVYTVGLIWKAIIDRDKKHDVESIHDLEDENKRLEAMLQRRGVNPDTMEDTGEYKPK